MVHVANRTGATCQFGYRLDATYASIHGMSPSVTWFRPDREVNFLRNLLTGEVVQILQICRSGMLAGCSSRTHRRGRSSDPVAPLLNSDAQMFP